MKIYVTSVFVDDQEKALNFYTEILGFEKKQDLPLGEYRWLTVVSKDDPKGTELLLEPSAHSAVPPFKQALLEDGIPFASFQVADLDSEFKRLSNSGVTFIQEPMEAGDVKMAILNDTCGNLIQLVEMTQHFN
ncbi:VOC family protein [Microbulbifer spongiae]|uniref:VOC family protein n=1 Tax=Microbulbifer spongiae TaxID=2944933 RepID=A0ABY9E7R5_9GAMM|nr:VOC family protein [Microbulbifer sp. MI-G]WKD48371.1 VOC family protein [Microbulbifer sp. MI-G]